MSFLAELRRRNVIRMAGLYIVGAWLVVQVAETLLPIFDTPGWVLKSLVLLLAIGLVPALVFSWVYELTPEGIKRESEVDRSARIVDHTARRLDVAVIVLILLAIGVFAFGRMHPLQAPARPAAAESAPAAGERATAASGNAAAVAAAKNSIAVLPFVNMSADEENEYFSDGISEELLNVLVKVEGLSVASRTSSFAYKGREVSAATIGGELKVAHVLEGSVRKAGNRVRITAQLIDTGSDRHLWSETYDRELTDIFAIQDEIAKAIVVALRDTLGEAASSAEVVVKADTGNVDAYQTYLKARELFLTRTRLDESVRLFEQVVALDPQFARGWEGLAAACAVIVNWVATYPDIDREALMQRSADAASRALALDPALSLPWAARALLVGYAHPVDHAEVMDHFGRAIAADPRNATALLWRGISWLALGFVDRGMADFDHCLEIDPAYANCLRWRALALLFQGRTEDALELFEQGMERGFNVNRGNSFVEPLIRRGDRLAAILLMRDIGWPLEIQQAIVAALADRRPPDDVAALMRRHSGPGSGEFTRGLLLRDYASAAAATPLDGTTVEFWDPAYEGMRASPAFKRILETLNVPAYWRAHGFPPQCRPLGEDDFACDGGRPGAAQ